MKKHVLVLLALLALIPFTQLMAQEPPPAQLPAQEMAAPAPDGTQCVATPSDEQAQVPSDLVSDSLSGTVCSSNSECPTGQLCCNICGALPFDGSSCMRCVQPFMKRCPLVV